MATMRELRALAKRRTKAAADKVRRNADAGVLIEGSEFDPRQPARVVAKMSRAQLNRYVKSVDGFMSRKVQFVPGMDGAPLPRELVRAYQHAESLRNARVAEHAAQFQTVNIAPSGMTVAQREATILASRAEVLRAGGTPEYRPYSERTRNMRGFPSAEALRVLLKEETRMSRPGAIRSALIAQRKNHVDWLEKHGHEELGKVIKGLTLKQFDVLKNYTDYSRHTEHVYLGKESAEAESWAAQIRDNNIGEAENLARWAKTVK